jgi:hypothetical protein
MSGNLGRLAAQFVSEIERFVYTPPQVLYLQSIFVYTEPQILCYE